MDDDEEKCRSVVVVKQICGTGKRTTGEKQKKLSILVVWVDC